MSKDTFSVWAHLIEGQGMVFPAMIVDSDLPLSKIEREFYGNVLQDRGLWSHNKGEKQIRPIINAMEKAYWDFMELAWWDYFSFPRYVKAVRKLAALWQGSKVWKKDEEFLEEHITTEAWGEDMFDKHPVLECPYCADLLQIMLDKINHEYLVAHWEDWGNNNPPSTELVQKLIADGLIKLEVYQMTLF